jgi:hypothetical protein
MMAAALYDLDDIADRDDDLIPARGIAWALVLSAHLWVGIAHLVMWLQ